MYILTSEYGGSQARNQMGVEGLPGPLHSTTEHNIYWHML